MIVNVLFMLVILCIAVETGAFFYDSRKGYRCVPAEIIGICAFILALVFTLLGVVLLLSGAPN